MQYNLSSFIAFLLILLPLMLQYSYGGFPVKHLPGFPGPLPFELETGYIGVDEGENVQLFYYFVKSGSNPEKDPIVLWLTGGPGCSVLSGLIYEIGPISFVEPYDEGLPTLTLKPNAWTEVANMIFLDLPVGVGFSFAKTPEASHSTGLQSCRQAQQFVQKWLADHPEFISNPFYVGGDSYTGLTVPVIVQMISDGNEMGIKPGVNLKGYLVGNGLTFPDEDNYRIPFAHGMGLIPDELYKSLKRNCGGKYINVDPSNLFCWRDLQTYHQLVDDLNEPHILEPNCPLYSPRPPNLSEERRSLEDKHQELYRNRLLPAHKCRTEKHKLAPLWANDPSVQESLHIQKGSIPGWSRCNHSLAYTAAYWDSTPYHANLSTKGFRSLIYSGDHDMVVSFLATQAWIRSLNYPIIDEWRQWLVQGQVAGYTRTYANNMTFATVKGAGHTAPEYRPLECAAMFKRWISNEFL